MGRFTLNDRLFGRFLATATESFATELRLKEMKDFFEANPEAGAGENYRKIAIETVTVIDKSLSEDEKTSTDSQNTLVTQTTKLVIGGRTYASEVSTSQSLDISDEIARYERFSFAEFVKCKFCILNIKYQHSKL